MIRGVASTLAALAGIWTAWLAITGGFDGRILGIALTSHEPFRPLLVTAIMLSIAMLAGADDTVVRSTAALAEIAARVTARPAFNLISIVALSITMFVVTNAHGSKMAGGSDSFGYISQADLWYESGRLSLPMPWARDVPWPDPLATFAPLSYHPGPSPDQVVTIAGFRPSFSKWSVVPAYSPGLPLLMALARAFGGHCAVFVVGPIFAGLFVLGTFALGTRVGSSRLGLLAALVLATSPLVLRFSLTPLSDVPVAAAWTLACYGALGRSTRAAIGAAVAIAVMLLIRPNLLPLAIVLAGWMFWRIVPDVPSRRRQAKRAAIAASGLAAAALGIATIYWLSYGSPTLSGYGAVSSFFGVSELLPNLEHYARWFRNDRTLLGYVGLVALFVPAARIWPRVEERSRLTLFAVAVLTLVAGYSALNASDNDAFMRFLLPVFPMIMIGLAAVCLALARLNRLVALAVVIGASAFTLYGARNSVGWLEYSQGEAQQLEFFSRVHAMTPENSVVLSADFSGNVWYHSGRACLRLDALSADWMDRAVAWMAERGVRTYAVLDSWEVDFVRPRFAGQKAGKVFDGPPLMRGGGLFFFDLGAPPATQTEIISEGPFPNRCHLPQPRPSLVLPR